LSRVTHPPHSGATPRRHEEDAPVSEGFLIPRRERSFFGQVGSGTIQLARTFAELYSIFVRTLYYIGFGKTEPGAISKQMYEIGNKSVFFMTVVMGFIGMILVYQAGLQTLRILPDLQMLGATFLELLVRDLAASIGALMLATRIGAGIAAEVGSMVVTEQVDALKMSAADPIDYLVKPRFIASVIMTTVLIIWAAGVAMLSGLLTGYVMFDLRPQTFFDLSLVDVGDLTVGLAKCVVYGAAIPIVSAHSGLTTHGGSEGVGWATTRAVVNSSLAVIMLNLFVSAVGFVVFP
jgi:phospholipid/cholesterol/gamma-HCH transport system permease protein